MIEQVDDDISFTVQVNFYVTCEHILKINALYLILRLYIYQDEGRSERNHVRKSYRRKDG